MQEVVMVKGSQENQRHGQFLFGMLKEGWCFEGKSYCLPKIIRSDFTNPMTIYRTLYTKISTAHILPKKPRKRNKKYPRNRENVPKKQKNGGKKYK